MEDFGFIIIRNINNNIDKNYWIECVRCIRKFYLNEKILIIDDNSKLIDNETYDFTNIKIVKSEYNGAGEILGYYYGWKYRYFKQFIVLHDSMFLQNKLPKIYQEVIFLWHFDKYTYNPENMQKYSNNDNNFIFINYCDKKEELLAIYYDNTKWLGCFGVSSIVTLNYLDIIFKKYNFINCIKHVKVRNDREAMERVFALIGFLEEKNLYKKPSLLGNILTDYPHAYNVKWKNYIAGYRNKHIINKIWSGR